MQVDFCIIGVAVKHYENKKKSIRQYGIKLS